MLKTLKVTLFWGMILAMIISMPFIRASQLKTNAAKTKEHKDNVKLYHYRAKVIKIYDADTITVHVQLGFNTYQVATLRLYGINGPEMRGEEKPQGIISRDWLRKKILGKDIIIQTIAKKNGMDKKGKFGRWLAVVWLDGVNLNQQMLDEGLAVPFMAEKFPE